MTENFAELLEESYSKLNNIQEDTIIKGTVVGITEESVVVDVGFKSESWVPASEFESTEDLKVGQEIEVYVEKVAGRTGETKLSINRVRKINQWKDLEDKMENKTNIKITPNQEVRGGLISSINSIPVFLPNSLVDVKPMKDPSSLIGKEIDVKILKMDKENNNILVSRRESVLETEGKDPKEIISKMNIGDKIMGTVKNVTNYGVFFELGGVDGLLHVTDISWKQSTNDDKKFNTGDSVELYITNIDEEKNRVSLGLKQLNTAPWDKFKNKYKVGDMVEGIVSKVEKYGAFIEIDGEIDGFIHSSEISWKSKNVNPIKVLSIGDKVTTKLTEIEDDSFRISLSIKQSTQSPWHKFAEEHKIGDKFDVEVSSVTEFGVFVKLNDDIDGFIPTTELNWDVKKSSPKDVNPEKKDKIEVVVKSMKPDEGKIALSVKMLEQNPALAYLENQGIKAGDKIVGKIKQFGSDEVFVEISNGLFLTVPNDSNDLKRGQELEIKVDEINDLDAKCSKV